jgi:hypothetical protein
LFLTEENVCYRLRFASQSDAQSTTISKTPSKTISPIKPINSTNNSSNIVFLKRFAKEKTFCKTKCAFVAKGLDIYFDEPNRF